MSEPSRIKDLHPRNILPRVDLKPEKIDPPPEKPASPRDSSRPISLEGPALNCSSNKCEPHVFRGKAGTATVEALKAAGEITPTYAKAEGTVVSAATGDTNPVDVGAKLGDVGAEMGFKRDGNNWRAGGSYRANWAEINGAVGSVSKESANDERLSGRASVGVTSGGIIVSSHDRDGDGVQNYQIDVDLPTAVIGSGFSIETETPVRTALKLATLASPAGLAHEMAWGTAAISRLAAEKLAKHLKP